MLIHLLVSFICIVDTCEQVVEEQAGCNGMYIIRIGYKTNYFIYCHANSP